ncbi:sugar isomerase domain-containing protein [Alkalihalobacillus trypoxylicola]|uniref:UPF0309 protein AZF04_10515 n=1 Tax=Alkalihalobacillus trypoxylicola TaxID=519424 RepID=A0A162D0N7_9BACI|nr:SIS domain-containing protein [Alkalihalobacillus trypoxylicola]KYG27618.1 hypothetical protein AZF04_10515 [Alkalihalobacillus trypoxylicola]
MLQPYLTKIQQLLMKIEKEESENLLLNAKKIANALKNKKLVHVFGCGHSHMLAEEVFYRSGGLAPINPIFIEDLMLHKGASQSSQYEKKQGFAETFLQTLSIEKGDILIVASTSGRNPVPIDVALYGKEKGAIVIGITSLYYSNSQSSKHSSGLHLSDVVDSVINNHIEVGDALISFDEENIQVGSGSSIAGMTIMNGLMVEAIQILINNGIQPPVFKSGNVDGSEAHNAKLIKEYQSRIPIL